jgi:hypothetical protein
MKERSPLQRDPTIVEMPTEDAVELLMRVYGQDEATARLIVEIEKGEIDGDAYGVADDSEVPTVPRPRSGNARAG